MSDESPDFDLKAQPSRAAEERELRAEIAARDRQENAIAELAQGALTGIDASILLGQACALVELTLETARGVVLEVDRDSFITRAQIADDANCANDVRDDRLLAGFVMTSGPWTT